MKCQLNISVWLLIAYLVLKYNLDYRFQYLKWHKCKRHNNDASTGEQTRQLPKGRHLILVWQLKENKFPHNSQPLPSSLKQLLALLPVVFTFLDVYCSVFYLTYYNSFFMKEIHNKSYFCIVFMLSVICWNLVCFSAYLLAVYLSLEWLRGLVWIEFNCSALQWLGSMCCRP